jgi:hypothetical protein
VDPFKKFRKYYKLKVYQETYSWFLQPVSIQDLESDLDIHPLIIKKQRDRPKTKRIRKGSWKRKPKQCSTCKEYGHDKRSCRKQPVANEQRQQVRDQADSLSDSSSSSTTNSSAIDGEINEQVDVELALYNQRIQRAQVAYQQMQEQIATELMPMEGIQATNQTINNENDSELSTVSSSRFSGLEED